ncbi:MAG: FGGY family carbohydrate kinase [Pseudolabrys sp.]
MLSVLVAIDQGTTSTRAIVFDKALAPLATAQRELHQIYPGPGLVEHSSCRQSTIGQSALQPSSDPVNRLSLKANGLSG